MADGLDILLWHPRLVAVDKPSGLPAVPGRAPEHHDSAYTRMLALHPGARVVHRLDMDTSGVLLFALDPDAERDLDRQLRERRVEKHYRARVQGHPADDAGLIDLPLARTPPGLLRSLVSPDGKPARTRYQVCARLPDNTALVDLFPETGRTHQLRVHLCALGHPILGDIFYAPPEVQARAPRLLLHAAALTFDAPDGSARLTVTAPLPDALR